MKREENTLSAVMRDAWDGKTLCVTTRKDPLKVKNATLGTINHITRAELLNKLTSTDRANGFANRYLLVWTERTKLLPHGNMGSLNCNEVVGDLHKALEAAKGRGEVERDEDAKLLWAEEYKRLTARAESACQTLSASLSMRAPGAGAESDRILHTLTPAFPPGARKAKKTRGGK